MEDDPRRRLDEDRERVPIRFGSGGWRGVLGAEFTFARARALAGAVAGLAAEERPGAPVLVGHDTRFLADRAAREVADALASAGARVVEARGPVPTPAVCRAVWRRGCGAGVVVTASHNPPEYLGLKVIGPDGACAGSAAIARLECDAARRLARGTAEPYEAPPAAATALLPVAAAYRRDLSRVLDRDVFRRAPLRVVYDAFHGAGAGVLDGALTQAGVAVTLRRGEPDPRFGGAAPDPVPGRLGPLRAAVRALRGRGLGLATDGDADRLAVVDADGRALSETETLALLVDYVAATRGARGTLALSRACGSLVAKVAEAHGLRVERHGLGFGPLAGALAAGHAVLAGDESGGFAFAPFARDKDGMLAGALLAERAARERAPLRRALSALARRHGRSACGRTAVAALPERLRALARLAAAPPDHCDGTRAVAADCADGVRVELADGGFVLWRTSRTEPVVRLYAEAPSAPALRRRLRAAHALLDGARP
ncbi:MAG TPA: phosphoglucomutase/phosphomannomutase family protein [Myxococcota bacterium]|nr:phosphoglucomutase/phosphomannomutase family protein [Myxococcota bacterium]